jgi:TrmH family RNA methyltransferase
MMESAKGGNREEGILVALARPRAGVSPRLVRLYAANNDYQYVEALRRNREKRHRSRAFFVEGVRPINLALAHRWPIVAFLYPRERTLSDWARQILATSPAEVHYELPPDLFATLSRKDEPSELLAVAGLPPDDLGRIPIHPALRVVVLDRPASPGNLGTLLRSGDALGIDGLIVAGHAADLYDPDTISASTGSLFAVPAVRVAGPAEVRAWLASARERLPNLVVVGSDERGAVDLAEQDFRRPTVLLLGNETWGLSVQFRTMADATVRIPIGGSASSLNVACAGSILLYELDRQRRRG